jgi:hypothetical protein
MTLAVGGRPAGEFGLDLTGTRLEHWDDSGRGVTREPSSRRPDPGLPLGPTSRVDQNQPRSRRDLTCAVGPRIAGYLTHDPGRRSPRRQPRRVAVTMSQVNSRVFVERWPRHGRGRESGEDDSWTQRRQMSATLPVDGTSGRTIRANGPAPTQEQPIVHRESARCVALHIDWQQMVSAGDWEAHRRHPRVRYRGRGTSRIAVRTCRLPSRGSPIASTIVCILSTVTPAMPAPP